MQEDIPNAQDTAVSGQGDLGIVELAAFLSRGDEILLPVLDPFDRSLQLQGEPGDEHFFGVEHHDLGTKGAADEWRDDPHLVLGQTEHAGETIADGNRSLGGVPDRQPPTAVVPVCDHAPILHGGRRPPVVEQSPLQDQIRLVLGHFVVALFLDDVGCEILIEIIVQK